MTKTTDQKLDELLEILTFVKDNGATQESLDSFKLETENNFTPSPPVLLSAIPVMERLKTI